METQALPLLLPRDQELPADTHLTREPLAHELTRAGFPISSRRLRDLASRGDGPPYALFGRRATYRWGDAIQWAKNRKTPVTITAAERRRHH